MAGFSKKGVVEVQFSWIFVIIVGALILLFFVSVTKSTQKSTDEKLYGELAVYLDNILSGAEIDVGTSRTITLPDIDVSVTCNEIIIEGTSSRGVDYKTIFSPDLIKGRKFLAYSRYFNMPYSVDYFLYVTSNGVRYDFINDSACKLDAKCQRLINEIKKYLPKNSSSQVIGNISDVVENGYYKERIVSFNKSLDGEDLDSSLKNIDVSGINIDDLRTSYGSIDYYEKNDVKLKHEISSAYLGFSMLLGAIVSEGELYECNVNKTMLKFRIMSIIYQNRTKFLTDAFSIYDPMSDLGVCGQIYDEIDLNDTISSLDIGINTTAFKVISRDAGYLSEKNEKDLLRQSCPLIY